MSWIKNYEDLYKIYPNGDVERYYKNGNIKILKHSIDGKGYKYVQLCKNGKKKNHKIHRLLAIYFIKNPNPIDFLVVDHIDRNPLNNNLENLRWTTQSINCRNSKNKGKYMKGVFKNENGKKFIAKIYIDGKQIYLGVFDTELEAHNCYMASYNKIIEDFNNL